MIYINEGLLDVQILGRGFVRLDIGTMHSLFETANIVEMVQVNQVIKTSVP